MDGAESVVLIGEPETGKKQLVTGLGLQATGEAGEIAEAGVSRPTSQSLPSRLFGLHTLAGQKTTWDIGSIFCRYPPASRRRYRLQAEIHPFS